MLKTVSWLVAACACLAFVAGPALAADMPATKPAAAPMKMAAKPHHKWSCYDYAWESQQMKDCLDKASATKPMHHPMHKKPMMKPAPATAPAAAPSKS